MLRKTAIILSLILSAMIFGSSASAQTIEEVTFVVNDSKLSTINLPNGARQVKDESVPQGVKETLAKLVAAGGDKVKQGRSEVILWEGNYKKTGGAQKIQQLEKLFKDSGWEYKIAARDKGIIFFTLLRTAAQRRALVGFFATIDDAFVICLTEMLPNNAPVAENRRPQ